MSKVLNIILIAFRERYKILFSPSRGLKKSRNLVNLNGQEVSDFIIAQIISGKPFLVSRFGSEELRWYRNYKILSRNIFVRSWNYISTSTEYWQRKYKLIDNLTFKPKDLAMTNLFVEKMDMAISEIDLLGSWLEWEQSKYIKFNNKIKFAFLLDLDPFFHENPWSLALKNKKVLIIHPMIDEILEQLNRRERLFSRPMLPEFQLQTIRAPFFDDPKFPNWQSIYKYYLDKIALLDDFEIAIVGCGSWGMPIAAEMKKMGKQVIHIGGSLQLLFGIKGRRWLGHDYKNTGYPELPNDFWIEPNSKPVWAEDYDNSSYWN